MAGVADMTVKVGADISDVVSKVSIAKQKLSELTEENGLLKEEIKDLNQSLNNNDKAISKINATLAKSTLLTKADKDAVIALRKERDSLSASGAKIQSAIQSSTKDLITNTAQLKEQTIVLKKVENAGSGMVSGVSKGFSALRQLANIIPGIGIGGLVALISGPLIDAFDEWYQSVSKVSDANKTLKENLQNFNDINEEANKNAAKQTASLQILYKAATDVNLSMKDRLSAVKGLQNAFPDYFKNIEAENVLNGNSKNIYDQLTESILRRAKADAAVNKLREIGAKQLDNEFKRQKDLSALNQETIKATGLKPVTQQLGLGQTLTVDAEALAQNAIRSRNKLSIARFEADKKDLQGQADFIQKFIGLSNLAESVESGIKPPKEDSVKKIAKAGETIEDVLKKLQIQINIIGQKNILPEQKVKEEVAAINSAISTLMQKFKLLSDNPVIIKLRSEAANLELSQLLKQDGKPVKIDIPAEFKVKPQQDIPYTDLSTPEIIRQNILKELARRGVTKTSPLKIEVPGGFVFTKSKSITGNESLEALQATLDESNKKLKEMAETTQDILSPAFDALFTGILTGSQNAFQSFGEALQKTIVQLGVALLKAAAFAAIFSALGLGGGGSFTSLFKKFLGFADGGLVKFSDGGHVRGSGSGRSDSILARVSNGEYIIPADIVSKFGVGFFDKLRKGMLPTFKNGIPGFANGGFISPNVIRSQNVPSVSSIGIGGGQAIQIFGDFQLRNDRLVAAVSRGTAKINRNS